MSGAPTISVVMPVYNAGRYLKPAVDSILEQSYGDFEFLVFDDGSTDGSAEFLRALCDSRVVAAYSGVNRGYIHWLNEGLRRARGRYIARMDADDLCDRDRLRRQIEFLEEHPTHVAVGASFRAVDGDGNDLGAVPIVHSYREIRVGLLDRSHFAHGAMLMRNTGSLSYNEGYYPAEDYDLWVRLLSAGRLANLPETLYTWRRHAEGTTQRVNEQSIRSSNRIRDRYAAELMAKGMYARLLEAVLSPVISHERAGELWQIVRSGVRNSSATESQRRALESVLLRNVVSPRLSARYFPFCVGLLPFPRRPVFCRRFLVAWGARRASRWRSR